MAVESIIAIAKLISEIPRIVESITLIVSQLQGRWREKEAIETLKRLTNQVGDKLKDFATLGHSIRDYSKLMGIATNINNRIDYILTSIIPEIKNAEKDKDKKTHLNFLNTVWKIDVQTSSNDLFEYFNMECYIDKIDEGVIKTLIEQSKKAFTLAEDAIKEEEFDKLEENLKDIYLILIKISGLCVTRLDKITEKCIAYEYEGTGSKI